MTDESAWQRRLERERNARKQAEELLEAKSRELYATNQELRSAHDELEDRVAERTRELEASRLEAIEANRAKSVFLANMSHEIRTPITAIQGFSEILIEQVADPELIEFAEIIHRNGDHLLTIINDILDLSKVEAGKVDLEQIECEPIRIINEVRALLLGRATEKGVGLGVFYEDAIPYRVRTDPTRLKQILINLLGNAIKFSEVGAVRLIVRAVRVEEDIRLEFDVIDSGIGMAEEEAARVFGQFEQADASITRQYGGTGLGLSISRRFAQLLGGDVTVVSSEPGVGSTFRLSITTPDLQGEWSAPVVTGQSIVARKKRPRASSGSLEGVRVLLAEDSPINQTLFTYILEREGIELTLVENGQRAIDAVENSIAARKPFDVVLMDMQMPVLDGYSAAGQLRRAGHELPIIALTAQAMQGDREKCLEAGCSGYVTKPIDRETLIEAIHDATSSVHG